FRGLLVAAAGRPLDDSAGVVAVTAVPLARLNDDTLAAVAPGRNRRGVRLAAPRPAGEEFALAGEQLHPARQRFRHGLFEDSPHGSPTLVRSLCLSLPGTFPAHRTASASSRRRRGTARNPTHSCSSYGPSPSNAQTPRPSRKC